MLAMRSGAPKKELPKARRIKRKEKKDSNGANDKHADGKTEVKGGQLHTMFTSLVDVQSEIDSSELRKDE